MRNELEFVTLQLNAMSLNLVVKSPLLALRKPARTIPFGPTGLADILQGFRLFAGSMDVMAPSIAEAARRLLRTEGATLFVPENLLDEGNKLRLAISDGIPKLIHEPLIAKGTNDRILVENLCQIGGGEPDTDICWIPTAPESIVRLWSIWVAQIHDLMVAGYPGCSGCGGPGSEGEWDEMASRARMRVNCGVT